MKRLSKLAMVTALLLAAVMALSACSGETGGTTAEQTTAGGTSDDADTDDTTADAGAEAGSDDEEFTLLFAFGMSVIPEEVKLVEQAISDAAFEKIGIKVELMPLSYAAVNQQLTLLISTNDKLDMIKTQTLAADVAQSRLLDMNPYLDELGPDIQHYLEDYLISGQFDGKQFAVPCIRNMGNSFGILMQQEYIEKYNVDVERLSDYDYMEEVFAEIHAAEPDKFITMGQMNIATIWQQAFREYNELTDRMGVLMGMDSLEVVNLFEQESYINDLKRIRGWYEAGYIPLDIATMTDTATGLVKAGKLVSFFSNIKPGYEEQAEGQAGGVDLTMVEIIDNYAVGSDVISSNLCIPITCGNVEKTVEFMNLMYGDTDIINLFDWGIEGKHYVINDEGLATFPEGLDAATSGYFPNLGWMFGNQPLSHVWEGNDPQLWENLTQWNSEATFSAAFGFNFDNEPVKTELTALQNVESQYRIALENGALDPDEVMDEFNEALYDAGLQKYMDEKQSQLDAWVASQP